MIKAIIYEILNIAAMAAVIAAIFFICAAMG
jgi:hypothetical protein